MESFYIIISICELVLIILGILLIKYYLPSYLQKKAENLATKEDIETITDKMERIKTEYLVNLEQIKNRLSIESQILGKRREIYDEIAKSLRIFIVGHKAGEKEKEHFLSVYSTAWLWAPDHVLIELNNFIALQRIHFANPSSISQKKCKNRLVML